MTSKMVAACCFVSVWSAVGARPARAHHSYAMFDTTRISTVVGTVRQFEWKMPHAILWLNASDEKGADVVWAFEFQGDGLNGLRRAGWAKDLIAAGEKITVTYAPLRDGRTGGLFRSLTRGNGETWDPRGLVPPGGRRANP